MIPLVREVFEAGTREVYEGLTRRITWTWKGKKRTTWVYSFKVDGTPHRRQGFLLQTETKEVLDAARTPSCTRRRPPRWHPQSRRL